jgi:hypothetical protein
VGREPRIEDDEDLMPQRIEALTLDGIDHGNEILLVVQIVRRIDLVEALILRDDRGGRGFRQLFHIDRE